MRKGAEIHRRSVVGGLSSPSPLCVPKTIRLLMPGMLLLSPAYVRGLVVAPVGLVPSGVVGSVHVLSVLAGGTAESYACYSYLCQVCTLIPDPMLEY